MGWHLNKPQILLEALSTESCDRSFIAPPVPCLLASSLVKCLSLAFRIPIQGTVCFFWKCRREGKVDRGWKDVIPLTGKRTITAELFPRKEFRNQIQHRGKMSPVGWELTIISCVETLTFSDIMGFFFSRPLSTDNVLRNCSKLAQQQGFALETKIWIFLPVQREQGT